MSATRITAPAVEPLSLDEAKHYLRVEHDDDDALIASLVSSGRNQVEALTRCGLLTQTWRFVRDCWPENGRIIVKMGPLRELLAVRVFNESGIANTLDPASFVVNAAGWIIAAPGWSLPAPGRGVAGIELDVEIGFGDNPSDVPPPLLQAVRMLLAHWYENRGLIAIGQTVAMMPASVNALISSQRVLSL